MSPNSAVRAYAMTRERIDTHSHYPGSVLDVRALAQSYAHLSTTQQLTDSRMAAAGCRRLYGVDPGPYLQPDAPEELFARAEAVHAGGARPLFELALDTARITTQLAFTDHHPEKSLLREYAPRVWLIPYIDELVAGDPFAYCPDGQEQPFCYYDTLCQLLGPLPSLDAYLDALDERVNSWRSAGAVAAKTAMAYTTGLHFDDPSLAEARQAFAHRQTMSRADQKAVQDMAFRHILLACQRNGLPIIIHTGFLIWGHGDLAQSNPMLLHPLLVDRRYRDLTFVLLHGGNPYVGETTYLAGMFPRVYIDFTWICWLTPTRFRAALAEWLEAVPHERICWGSDTGTPECIVGIDELVRTQIADVLEESIGHGTLDEKTALAFLNCAYETTARSLFGL